MDENRQLRGVVVQTYSSDAAARAAIEALQGAGFESAAISVAAQDTTIAGEIAADSGGDVLGGAGTAGAVGASAGAGIGLLLGIGAVALPGIGLVIAGPLAAALAGAGAGGLLGGLLGLGISEDDAAMLRDRIAHGEIAVTVVAGEREADARRILDGDPARSTSHPAPEEPN